MSLDKKIPIVETYRSVGVHAFQGPDRIEVVKRAIDHVLTLRDLEALEKHACDIANPPETRLLAKQVLEEVFALAAESREKQPTADVDLQKVRLATVGPRLAPLDRPPLLRDNPRRRRQGPGARFRAKVPRDQPVPGRRMSDDSHCHAGGHGELDSSISVESGSRKDAERFRALMVELGARPEYVAAIDPATAFQRMTRERNAAIVAALEFYPGSASGSARELARSWTRYLAAAWKRGRGPEGRDRLAALHELCRITDGAEPLSPGQIERIARDAHVQPIEK